jgi:hypothetical protein
MMKPGTRKVWRFVGISVSIVVVAFIATAFWFVLSHRTSADASVQLADLEFARLRARFGDQQPLLDMQRREVGAALAAPNGPARLHSFHTVIFDTRGRQRLIRIEVPYWFARRFAGRDGEFTWLGQLTFLDDTEFDPEAIRLSVDQLERRGPGLVAYYSHPGGGRFISWVE